MKRIAEANTIFALRMTIGDDEMQEQAKNLSGEEQLRLAHDHPNQTRGIVEP